MKRYRERFPVLGALLLCCACGEEPVLVHRAVSATVAHYVPGLALGGGLGQTSARLSSVKWVQHVGAVGTAPPGWFSNARLYPDSATRARPEMKDAALVRALELTSENSSPTVQVLSDLMIAFRGTPKQGCLGSVNGDARWRSVNYWVAPENGGGVAVIEEWGGQSKPGDGVFWSLFAWSGPFRGSETFLAPFAAHECDGNDDALVSGSVRATAQAVERIDVAFKDSVRGLRTKVAELQHREITNADAPDACAPPWSAVVTKRHVLAGVTIDLPTDVDLIRTADITGSGYKQYEFRSRDGMQVSIEPGVPAVLPHGIGGMVMTHCDMSIHTREVHIDVLNGNIAGPQLRVRAEFYRSTPGSLTFDGSARTQAGQRELLRAVHSIMIDGIWGMQGRE